jgi:hypothetical protein
MKIKANCLKLVTAPLVWCEVMKAPKMAGDEKGD